MNIFMKCDFNYDNYGERELKSVGLVNDKGETFYGESTGIYNSNIGNIVLSAGHVLGRYVFVRNELNSWLNKFDVTKIHFTYFSGQYRDYTNLFSPNSRFFFHANTIEDLKINTLDEAIKMKKEYEDEESI